jgi:hypothetical protein
MLHHVSEGDTTAQNNDDGRGAGCRATRRGSTSMTTLPGTWSRRVAVFTCAFAVLGLATTSHADATGSWAGSFSDPLLGEIAVASGALTETAGSVTGTVTIEFLDPDAAGVYQVSGTATATKVKLKGTNAAGASFKWKGLWTSDNALDGKAKVKTATDKVKGTLLLGRNPAGPGGFQPCESAFFDGEVMGLVLQPVCAACHVPGGVAQATTFRVTLGDALATQRSIALHIDTANPAASAILQKPLALVSHGGGQQISPDSDRHLALAEWVDRVASGSHCDTDPGMTGEPLTPDELLIRASMDLRGRRPSLADLDAVSADPNTYEARVDAYLGSPEFIERVKDIYDDALLVRREDFREEDRAETWALYAEALELLAYIVANDRPFTEIGTADYTVANELFQQDLLRMPFPMEPVTGAVWQPSHYLDGRPHAGLLTTSAFYEVWDTNNTNKNRRRANRWSILFHCYDFLDTPVDVTRDVDNSDDDAVLDAVTTRADCRGCHATLDPLASFLFTLDHADGLESEDPNGFYRQDHAEYWRTANRRPPAVYGVPGLDLGDLGRLLTENERFAQCQTRRAFELLFLRAPATSAELTTASDIATRWRTEDGYNYRALVKRWLLADVYRTRPTAADPAWVRRVSPERLETLFEDLTGFVWTRTVDDPAVAPIPRLTSEDRGFKIILGGVNGVSVTRRAHSLNASVALVHRKVAALAASHVVDTEFGMPDGERRLLAGVRGDENPAVDAAPLRAHIARLARRFYGERWAPDGPQVDVWFTLYDQLYRDRTQASLVPGTAGVRAWRGMLAAMLRSPRILLY